MEYTVQWYSQSSGGWKDITSLTGNVKIDDDVESLAVSASCSVRQGRIDPYFPVLGMECDDRIKISADGTAMFEGGIQDIEYGDLYQIEVTAYDDGQLLSQNELVIQFNEVSASDAVSQLCERVGIPVGEIPDMGSIITHIYQEAVNTILEDILDTVTADTGREFYIRVKDSALNIIELTDTVTTMTHKPAGNLAPFDVTTQPGKISVKRSSADLRNAVQITSGQDEECTILASVEDAESISTRGRRQKLEQYDDEETESAAVKAANLLEESNKLSEEISVTLMGSTAAKSGIAIVFDWPDLSGTFRVNKVSHSLGDPYTMDLTLLRLE